MTAETIAELICTAMDQLEEGALVAAAVEDDAKRHEICARILGAYGLIESVLGKVTNGKGQGASRARKRLALLGRRYVPGDPERVADLAERFLDRARRAAEA